MSSSSHHDRFAVEPDEVDPRGVHRCRREREGGLGDGDLVGGRGVVVEAAAVALMDEEAARRRDLPDGVRPGVAETDERHLAVTPDARDLGLDEDVARGQEVGGDLGEVGGVAAVGAAPRPRRRRA